MEKETGTLVLAGATSAMVLGIYQIGSPGIANVKASEANDKVLSSTERGAAWLSAAVVGGVSIVAREPMVFIFGSALIIGLSWWHRTANMSDPKTEALKSILNVGSTHTVPVPGSSDVGTPTAGDGDMVGSLMDGIF